MHAAVLWCVFAGSWLLVVGPLYQAALELGEEEAEMTRIRGLASNVAAPPPLSAWWWLLPPVRLILNKRRSDVYRELLVDVFTDDDYATVTAYVRKATGWMLVGVGGFLHAPYYTYSVTEHYEWPVGVFWGATVALLALSFAFVGNNQTRSDRRRPGQRTPRGGPAGRPLAG